jgi:hypothetical protein
MATLRVVNIPEDLKNRFRAICKSRRITMSNAVLELIKGCVGEEIAQEAVGRFRKRHFRP